MSIQWPKKLDTYIQKHVEIESMRKIPCISNILPLLSKMGRSREELARIVLSSRHLAHTEKSRRRGGGDSFGARGNIDHFRS